MIRVLVVDDHRLVRDGLVGLLAGPDDIEVVGQAETGADVVDVARTCAPDVVLMDLSMPDVDGIEATRRLHADRPDVRVVALTSFSDRRRVDEALAAGATGYLLKDCAPTALFDGVRAAARGQAPIDPRVAVALLPTPQTSPLSSLSGRETEVLRLVAAGMANKQIARSLGISEHTVKIHLGNAFRRIGVRDRTSAALWARDHLGAGRDG